MSAPDVAQRRKLAAAGKAMPDPQGSGGRFPIRNREDLAKAIRAVGRAKGDRNAVRRWIMKRARALGMSAVIPENCPSDGGLKES